MACKLGACTRMFVTADGRLPDASFDQIEARCPSRCLLSVPVVSARSDLSRPSGNTPLLAGLELSPTGWSIDEDGRRMAASWKMQPEQVFADATKTAARTPSDADQGYHSIQTSHVVPPTCSYRSMSDSAWPRS